MKIATVIVAGLLLTESTVSANTDRTAMQDQYLPQDVQETVCAPGQAWGAVVHQTFEGIFVILRRFGQEYWVPVPPKMIVQKDPLGPSDGQWYVCAVWHEYGLPSIKGLRQPRLDV